MPVSEIPQTRLAKQEIRLPTPGAGSGADSRRAGAVAGSVAELNPTGNSGPAQATASPIPMIAGRGRVNSVHAPNEDSVVPRLPESL